MTKQELSQTLAVVLAIVLPHCAYATFLVGFMGRHSSSVLTVLSDETVAQSRTEDLSMYGSETWRTVHIQSHLKLISQVTLGSSSKQSQQTPHSPFRETFAVTWVHWITFFTKANGTQWSFFQKKKKNCTHHKEAFYWSSLTKKEMIFKRVCTQYWQLWISFVKVRHSWPNRAYCLWSASLLFCNLL